MKGKQRLPFHLDAAMCKVYMSVRKIPLDRYGLKQVDEAITELIAQRECGYWTHPMDRHEIEDAITRARQCFDYIDFCLSRDYSHYDDYGRASDDDGELGDIQDPLSTD
jgi:hypothetical protein